MCSKDGVLSIMLSAWRKSESSSSDRVPGSATSPRFGLWTPLALAFSWGFGKRCHCDVTKVLSFLKRILTTRNSLKPQRVNRQRL